MFFYYPRQNSHTGNNEYLMIKWTKLPQKVYLDVVSILAIAKLFLDSIVRENVKAFIDRAEAKYGPPSRESKQKSVVVNNL